MPDFVDTDSDFDPPLTPRQTRNQRIAVLTARAQVAGLIGWPMAIGWGCAALLQWDSWLIAAAVVAGTYWFGVRPHQKALDEFENGP